MQVVTNCKIFKFTKKNDWSYYQLTLKVHNSQNCIEILIVTHYNSLMLIHSSEIPLKKLRKNSNSFYDHNSTMVKSICNLQKWHDEIDKGGSIFSRGKYMLQTSNFMAYLLSVKLIFRPWINDFTLQLCIGSMYCTMYRISIWKNPSLKEFCNIKSGEFKRNNISLPND